MEFLDPEKRATDGFFIFVYMQKRATDGFFKNSIYWRFHCKLHGFLWLRATGGFLFFLDPEKRATDGFFIFVYM